NRSLFFQPFRFRHDVPPYPALVVVIGCAAQCLQPGTLSAGHPGQPAKRLSQRRNCPRRICYWSAAKQPPAAAAGPRRNAGYPAAALAAPGGRTVQTWLPGQPGSGVTGGCAPARFSVQLTGVPALPAGVRHCLVSSALRAVSATSCKPGAANERFRKQNRKTTVNAGGNPAL